MRVFFLAVFASTQSNLGASSAPFASQLHLLAQGGIDVEFIPKCCTRVSLQASWITLCPLLQQSMDTSGSPSTLMSPTFRLHRSTTRL